MATRFKVDSLDARFMDIEDAAEALQSALNDPKYQRDKGERSFDALSPLTSAQVIPHWPGQYLIIYSYTEPTAL